MPVISPEEDIVENTNVPVVIKNEAEAVLRTINNLNAKKAWRIAHVFGDNVALELGQLLEEFAITKVGGAVDLFDMLGFGQQSEEKARALVGWAFDTVELKAIEARERKKLRTANKAANRAEYLHEPVFTFYKREDDEGNEVSRWNGDTDLRSKGLLSRVVTHLHGEQVLPPFAGIINGQSIDPETGVRKPITDEQWTKFTAADLVVSGERLVINRKSPVWKLAVKCFPQAIDMAAYIHSLNAPVLPEGFFADCDVQFRKLQVDGVDLETDGSGYMNIDNPAVADFIAKYGLCPVQFRCIEPKTGLFAKGIMRPVKLGPDVPAFVLDWNQVKGVHKDLAMERRHENAEKVVQGCFVGALQVWNRRGKLSSCFEMLENIERTPTTKSIIDSRVKKAMEKLVEGGVDALVAKVARDDETIKSILQFNTALKAHGDGVPMTAIPRVRAAVKEKLGRKLWHVSQGAGISFDRYVVFLDSTVAPGTIVAPDWKPGTMLAGFRFPMVLAQGLVSLKVVKPKAHQRCGDETVPFAVFMNPSDITTKMQGDDDGDTVGLTSDKDMVELFKHLVDNRVYHIEPARQKHNIASDSPEGIAFIRRDQRGYVGRTTVYRSQLLAVGAIEEANAMSVCIQENIDCAKGKVRWTDPRKVVGNWEADENGELRLDPDVVAFDEEDLNEGYFPLDLVKAWKDSILIARGCCYISRNNKLKAKNPLGWRYPNKRIVTEKWNYAAARNQWAGGNLVHACNDMAFDAWQVVAEKFSLEGEELNLAMVVPMLLGEPLGTDVLRLTWDDYNKGLRHRCGLRAYGKVFSNIESRNLTDDDKFQAIADANAALIGKLSALADNVEEHLSLLATIWMMELLTETEAGINNAFRAVCWPGSPVMTLLGIEEADECRFLDSHNREQVVVNLCLQAEDPFAKLAEVIFHSHLHSKKCVDEDNNPVHGWECPTCRDRLETSLVTRIRNDKKRKEHGFMKSTVSKLNGRA